MYRSTRLNVAAALLLLSLTAVGSAADRRSPFGNLRLDGKVMLTDDVGQIFSALAPKPPVSRQVRLRVNDERSRGSAMRVYPKVAPAVVLVRTRDGHGSGFLIDKSGWIVTNHHVVKGAEIDPASGARRVTIYMGRLQDGWMHVREQGLPALVYKIDKRKDLALLKLSRLPAGLTSLPFLKLAKHVPPPGSDCVAIGHPALGVLWTLRSGQVAGSGTWPQDRIDVVVQSLALTGSRKKKLMTVLKSAPKRRVIVSTCGLNPGDSGGPLVNEQGELIAVSFAIPTSTRRPGISVDKFSYHIHLAEVRSFIADRPARPALSVPDAWPPAVYRAMLDTDKDGRADTLVFVVKKDDPPTGLLLDLDQDSGKRRKQSKQTATSLRTAWDFEFGYHRVPMRRTFYDTDNDGHVDLILTDADGNGRAETELTLHGDTWHSKPTTSRLIDPSRFRDSLLQESLSRRMHTFGMK